MNLILGAAEPGAVAEGHLEAALEWVGSFGVAHRVPLTPTVATAAAAEDWLNQRGYEHSHSRARFTRDAAPRC